MTPSNDDFLSQLMDAQDEILDASETLSYARERLDRPVQTTHPGWVAGPVLAAGLSLAALSLWLVRPASPIQASVDGQALAAGVWVGAESEQVEIAFSDGTEVALQPGAQARVVALDAHGAQVLLEQGEAHFDVEHRSEETSWTIQAGPFEVAVVGTAFSASWDPESGAFVVDMDEGEVAVTGPHLGTSRAVRNTEVLEVWLDQGRSVQRNGPAAAVHRPEARPELAPLRPPAVPERAPQGSAEAPSAEAAEVAQEDPTWQELARASRYGDAVQVARQEGLDAILTTADGGALVLLGDSARLAGDPTLAKEAYSEARARYAGSDAAAMAAFALGRLAFDRDADMAAASEWFAVCLGEQPDGPLAREALGRRMEAEHRQGHRAAARSLAVDYLTRFPDGPHEAAATQLAGRRGR